MYKQLSQSYALADMIVANRVCLPPMVVWAASENGFVTEQTLSHYKSFRGIGLAIVEATAISPEGRLAATQIGAWSDEHIAGLRQLAAVLSAGGAVPGIQIHHAGRQTKLANTFGEPLVAPSAVTTGPDMPEALSLEGIKNLVTKYAAAANRAVQAGFKVIELHGAHGYLISQFLSPTSNLRTDAYGGALENRARFALEVVQAVKSSVGDRALVSMRLGVIDSAPEGLSLEEGTEVAVWLEKAGLDLLHISSGIGGVPAHVQPEGSEFSSLLHLASFVKRRVSIPVIGVGGIKTPEQAERALEANMADIIAVGRGLLADPLWAQKALHEPDAISLCRGCRPCGLFKRPAICPARK